MDLALTEAQQMLKRLTRDLLDREFPTSLARELEQDERGHSPEVWRKMVETGLVNAAFPEQYGGAGGGLTDLGVIFDEMGRGLYTGPYFATVALGGLALLYAGTEDQRRGLIPAVAQGQALLSLALLEETGKYAPDAIRLDARARGDHFVLSGVKLFVEYANVADFILCAARTGPGVEDISLFLVPCFQPRSHHCAAGHHGRRQAVRGDIRRGARARPQRHRRGRRRLAAPAARARRRNRAHLHADGGHGREGAGAHRRLRQDARAVRPPHRLAPGRTAPLRRHGHQLRRRHTRGAGGGLAASTRA